MKKKSIKTILLNSKYVNNYTKLLLILDSLDYYKEYYIPNKKLERMLNINKNRVIILLNQAESEGLIKLVYRGRKRYFLLNNQKEDVIDEKKQLFDYNWLEDDEWED